MNECPNHPLPQTKKQKNKQNKTPESIQKPRLKYLVQGGGPAAAFHPWLGFRVWVLRVWCFGVGVTSPVLEVA